jgi:hypothetical protein
VAGARAAFVRWGLAAACAGGSAALVCVGSAGAAASSLWRILPTPNPPGAVASELLAVSCASASACTAVGFGNTGSVRALLAERWDGTRWSIELPAAPPAGSDTADLTGVSCPTAGDCTAVGAYRDGAGETLTLAERWDGTAWRRERTVNRGRPGRSPLVPSGSELNGVSCSGPAACTAVGDYLNGAGTSVALVERWNGARWALERTPRPTGRPLGSVSCSARSACTAVGQRDVARGRTPLAERWDGAGWTRELTPGGLLPGYTPLVSVSCVAAWACTAVGERTQRDGGYGVLVERWDGANWLREATPPRRGGVLGAVSCASRAACTAVGTYAPSASLVLPLIERWDGGDWTLESAPLAAGASGGLLAVSCSSKLACIAVGLSTSGSIGGGNAHTVTLAEIRA